MPTPSVPSYARETKLYDIKCTQLDIIDSCIPRLVSRAVVETSSAHMSSSNHDCQEEYQYHKPTSVNNAHKAHISQVRQLCQQQLICCSFLQNFCGRGSQTDRSLPCHDKVPPGIAMSHLRSGASQDGCHHHKGTWNRTMAHSEPVQQGSSLLQMCTCAHHTHYQWACRA